MEKNLTSGSVFKNILIFSLPYLLSYLLQTLYGMADLYIIGQFGSVADSSAVSIGSQVMHMLTVMIVGLAMGATVFIGQSIGADDKKNAAKGIGNTVTIFMAVSVVLTVILVALVKPVTIIMSTPTDAVSGTIDYLTICFVGIPFITAYNVISAIFRGMGDSKSPMYFIAIACVANIGLDYLFMGVCHLGPAGAALGTTLSQAISVIVSLVVILKRKTGISLAKADFKPYRPVMDNILKIGIPVALQDGLIQIAFIVITIIANSRGLSDSTAVGIVEKVMSFLFLVPSSMLSTVSALGEQAQACSRYATLCCFPCRRVWLCRCGSHSILGRAGGIPVYRRNHRRGRRGCSLGWSISPGLCMGLHFCWCAFLFQRIFLRRGKIRHFFPAQHYRHCPYAYSRRLLDFYAVPHNAAPDGISYRIRLHHLCGNLFHCIYDADEEKQTK